ncbi:hypothetical protein ILP92_02540 [Maribius pontilimi]|uniref:Uncharacterized protein n=1 Tax=Palleronia pontilimi TaxID=1964209 RepID=A0A934MBE5_9RHOB|nr:hypothetical protein [Palleronia pontilimi]MBJ3761628.1 hypothetical protein [Palleronia pontilimi]
MSRMLVIEKSPVVATDIVETVCGAFPQLDAVAVMSIEDAEAALSDSSQINLCIVSGSTTHDRLTRLAALLGDRRVRTVVMTDDTDKSDLFGSGTIHLSQPFTSEMLLDAVRRLSHDA